jgi:hypothetical protein
LFSESSSGQQALATVGRAIDEIDGRNTARLIAAQDSGKDRAARREVILDGMRTIARTSRRVVEPSGKMMRLRMPRRIADVAVVTAAERFLTRAEAHHDEFVRLGLPATCLSDLRQALGAFEGAMAERRLGRANVASARAAIRTALRAGSDAASELDVIVRNAAGEDVAVLAAWERDLRIVGDTRTANRHPEPVAPADAVADASDPEPGTHGPDMTPEQEVAPLRQAI